MSVVLLDPLLLQLSGLIRGQRPGPRIVIFAFRIIVSPAVQRPPLSPSLALLLAVGVSLQVGDVGGVGGVVVHSIGGAAWFSGAAPAVGFVGVLKGCHVMQFFV